MTTQFTHFNFHHRVVETLLPILVGVSLLFFNFHHRVVETKFLNWRSSQENPLTFTIGWLKRRPPERRGAEAPFNFHHRVVETYINGRP